MITFSDKNVDGGARKHYLNNPGVWILQDLFTGPKVRGQPGYFIEQVK